MRYFFTENPSYIDQGYLKRVDKRFRVVNGILIPYVTTTDLYHNHKIANHKEYDSLSPESNFSLQEVILGPHGQQQLVGKGVKEFLDYQKLDHVTIKNSAISYRNVK